jgi:uncharacterized protein (TIGR03086 family)
MHIKEFDARAVRDTIAIVAKVSADDLTKPTPCSEWTLAELIAHMTAQHNGFAVASTGASDPEAWTVKPANVTAYREAAERVIAAFAASTARRFPLPEIGGEFAAAQAIGFHFIDYLVHGWDVAQAIGIDYTPEPDLVAAALPIAEAVPDGNERRQPGSAFAPSVATPQDASAWDRILAMLGRSPRSSPY